MRNKVIRRETVMNERGRNVERSVILCDCGSEVLCMGFTNTCRCGTDYNMSGSRLAARSHWGEETGEHPADIARIK